MSRPARRRRWPSISRYACAEVPSCHRDSANAGGVRFLVWKRMLWWADGGVGHTPAPGPAWRRPGAVSVIEGSFGCQLFDGLQSLAGADPVLLAGGRLRAIMRCWNGPGVCLGLY